jgi:hypothetical protein
MRGPKLIGRQSTWREMLEVAHLGGQPSTYAMGLFRHLYRGVEVIHHPGSVLGGSSQMLTVPAHELDIVVLVNGAPVKPAELTYKIVDALLDKALGPPATMATAERFSHLIGQRYHCASAGFLVGFDKLGDGKLGFSLMNEPGVPIREIDGNLELGFEDAGTGPIRVATAELGAVGDSGAPETLRISESGHVEHFERIPSGAAVLAESASHEAERALAGRYHADDLDADALVRFDGGNFDLRVLGGSGVAHMALARISDSVYGVRMLDPTLPLFGVLTVDRAGGNIVGFRISTARTRNLRFSRLVS